MLDEYRFFYYFANKNSKPNVDNKSCSGNNQVAIAPGTKAMSHDCFKVTGRGYREAQRGIFDLRL